MRKNIEEMRDPEKNQTKKGNQWYFGMKVHAGVDKDSGPIHSMLLTVPNLPDLTPFGELLHADEVIVYGYAGYQGIAKSSELAGKAMKFRVVLLPGQRRALLVTPQGRLQNLIEAAKAHFSSKVQYSFYVIQQQFDVQKTRLLGLAKKRCMINVLATLINPFMSRCQLHVAA
jgi:transposase, IS5 family